MKFIFRPALLFMALSPLHLWAVTFEGPDGDKFEFAGFTKHEWSRNGANVRVVPDNESTYRTDARNAFWPVPSADQATQLPKNSQLSMQQISLGWSKETTGAVGLEGKLTYRWRSSDVLRAFYSPDVDYRLADGNPLHRDFTEQFLGISRPDLGAFKLGTQLSRSWSRSDAFTFPIGLSGVWADSGAGYGILPTAVRYTSPMMEDGSGKLTFEATFATHHHNTYLVDQQRTTQTGVAYSPNPTTPKSLELFLQYSNEKNLIELTFQTSQGAKQSSFGKSALVGWIGDPDTLSYQQSLARNAAKPSQSVIILQGNHWANTQNMYTWGLRRSQWSGSAASCNYNTALGSCVFGLDPGFNYGSSTESYLGYQVTSFDALLGWSRYDGLFTYTVGGVYFGRASSKNPIEWGQSNSAIHVNFGVARKVPEIDKGLIVTFGVARTQFEKLGPAPVSMPNNNFLTANPLYDKTGHSATLGMTWVF
jgi:hypothetical protein